MLYTLIAFGLKSHLKNLTQEFLEIENNFNMVRNKLEEQILEVNTSNNELKILNIELIKTKNKLEELSNYRGRFIANMSHELRTPLNAIIGFSHVLLESEFTITEEEKQNLIKTIHNSGKKLLNIINNILDLSDLKQDILEPSPKYIDVAPTLEALASTAKGLLKDSRSIILNIRLKNYYPHVYADEKALNKVLTHILENATKYTKKGEITIYTEEDENHLYVIISDTGIGMTEDELKRVFEPFTKLIMQDQPLSLSEGVGIGMPISKYLMEKMSGDLIVTSKKDYGTTVKIVLKKEKKND
ncbi:MAG: HAMP domain-containing histidine kinase [Calditerrivibrio sp.]|nr:HAMP domain-containing histidine kinase [Calditerrivibrio sp.]